MIWFNTKGQKIQTLFAGVSVLLAGVNAWPSISNLHFTAIAPLVFYFVVAAGAISLALFLREKPADNSAQKADATIQNDLDNAKQIRTAAKLISADATSVDWKFVTKTTSLKKGQFWSGGDGISEFKITYYNLIHENGTARAELGWKSLMDLTGGSLTKIAGDRSRFLVPSTEAGLAVQVSLFSFSINETYSRFDLLRVDHINPHTEEIQLTLFRAAS